MLSNFEFKVVVHREGAKHGNANALSHCEHAPEPIIETDKESTLCRALEDMNKQEINNNDEHDSLEQACPKYGPRPLIKF